MLTTLDPYVGDRGLMTTWRLGRRTRKAFLVLHISSISAWIGIDVAMGVLVYTAMTTDTPHTAAISYQALNLFVTWPLVVAGVLSLVTGVVLGLGSKYGLVRYWWVGVKLVMNLVLVGLVLFLLRPGLTEAATYGRELAAGQPAGPEPDSLPFPPIVSLTALTIAVVLSVYKPWGRIRARVGWARRDRSVHETG